MASWDGPGTEIDIESELRNIATQCPQGEELRSGNHVSKKELVKKKKVNLQRRMMRIPYYFRAGSRDPVMFS